MIAFLGKERNEFLISVFEPRKTIRNYLKNLPMWYILLWSFFAVWATNLLMSFQSYTYELIEDSFEYQTTFKELIMSAMYSLGEILILLIIYAAVLFIVGKLFKGKGTLLNLYKGSLIVMFPFIILLPILAVWLVLATDSFYGVGEKSAIDITFLVLVLLLAVLATVISIIYCIVMVSEVHQISKWQAFLVLFMTMIIFTILLIIIIFIVAVVFIVMGIIFS